MSQMVSCEFLSNSTVLCSWPESYTMAIPKSTIEYCGMLLFAMLYYTMLVSGLSSGFCRALGSGVRVVIIGNARRLTIYVYMHVQLDPNPWGLYQKH